MDLTNEFRVAVPVERAWAVLTDLERIAPCMPGAQLQEVEGDIYRGVVKVKVGPVQAAYKGEVTFVESDEAAHVAVLRAEGLETRGQGKASATITATLTPDGDGTAVAMNTDLAITGRVAQFGRSVLADVSSGLLDQFVTNLETTVLAEETVAEPPATSESPAGAGSTAPSVVSDDVNSGPVVRTIDSPDVEPVDLMATAGSPVVKRIVPVLVAVLIGYLVLRFVGRRRRAAAYAASQATSAP